MLQDTLYQQRPSRHETFARDVQAMIDLVRSRPDQRAADYPGLDGQWAVFCMGYISQQENQLSGQLIGWLDPIGTRPAFRRQGLAQALLLTNLQQFHARGLAVAGTTTTASNNVAMQRTAESVGFRVTATTSWYQKRL